MKGLSTAAAFLAICDVTLGVPSLQKVSETFSHATSFFHCTMKPFSPLPITLLRRGRC